MPRVGKAQNKVIKLEPVKQPQPAEVTPQKPTKPLKEAPIGKEFVFVNPENHQHVGRAKHIKELAEVIKTAPLQSVLYHANGNHFKPWLEMIGETELAKRIQYIKGNGESVRKALYEEIMKELR